jgi:hypothetical protein
VFAIDVMLKIVVVNVESLDVDFAGKINTPTSPSRVSATCGWDREATIPPFHFSTHLLSLSIATRYGFEKLYQCYSAIMPSPNRNFCLPAPNLYLTRQPSHPVLIMLGWFQKSCSFSPQSLTTVFHESLSRLPSRTQILNIHKIS